MNRIEILASLGQSIWLDNIDRRLLDSGELSRLIAQGVRGLTSNPSIFEKAIASTTGYDLEIATLASQGCAADAILERVIVGDIQRAADLFRPVYERSAGADGFVSVEVSPALARDGIATVAAARRLWRCVDRRNAMIKIPATREGLPAIRQCLAEGINVNATLIFSVARYREVVAAYREALESRAARGESLDVASVASFFVSRVDSAVDRLLDQRLAVSADASAQAECARLLGKAAVANAALAYREFGRVFGEPWFTNLAARGARVQRPLWASTGVKNPRYPDLLYVEPLVARDTVNTVPPATLAALLDHGAGRPGLVDGATDAAGTLAALERLGISLDAIAQSLEDEGVALFARAHAQLLAAVAAKVAAAKSPAVA